MAGWYPWSAVRAQGDIVGGEEVDVQAGFGAAVVANSEATVGVVLEAVVVVVDVAVCGIDPDAEQAAGRDAGSRSGEVVMGLVAGAVLEDLDSHHQVVSRCGRQSSQVAGDEVPCAVGTSLAQLRDRCARDVEPDQVESSDRLNGPAASSAAVCLVS